MTTEKTSPGRAPRTLLEHAYGWLAAPLYEMPNRWEFLLCLAIFGYAVWTMARAWGRAGGIAEGMRMERRRMALDATRAPLDPWREQFRADIADGVVKGLEAHERAGAGGRRPDA